MRSLLKIAIVTAIGFAVWHFALRGGCGTKGALECPADKAIDEGIGVTLARAESCNGAGYLCFEKGGGNLQVVRWPLDTGKLRVRIGPPEFEADAELAKEIHQAAIEGVMEWDRHPFPLVLETGKRTPLRGWDIGIVWHQGQGGGHARITTNQKGKRLVFGIDGLQVLVPPVKLAGSPEQIVAQGGDPQAIMAKLSAMATGVPREQMLAMVKATAAHEMGHALGLMHSDSERDIMFPQFRPGRTPDRISARDVQTVEALYALPNGAMIQ